MRSLLRSAAATLVLVAIAACPAQAAKVKVKNCTDQKIVACTFNSWDSANYVPYKYRTISSGDKETLKCDSNRCKVWVGPASNEELAVYKAFCATGAEPGDFDDVPLMVVEELAEMGTLTAAVSIATGYQSCICNWAAANNGDKEKEKGTGMFEDGQYTDGTETCSN